MSMASYRKRLHLEVQKHVFRDYDDEEIPEEPLIPEVTERPTVLPPLHHNTIFVTNHRPISPADNDTVGSFASQNYSSDNYATPNYSTDNVTDNYTNENHSDDSITGNYSTEHYATDNYTVDSHFNDNTTQNHSIDNTLDTSTTDNYSTQHYSADTYTANSRSTDNTTHNYSTDSYTRPTNRHSTNATQDYPNGNYTIQNYSAGDNTFDGYIIQNFTTRNFPTENYTGLNYETENTHTTGNYINDDYVAPNYTDTHIADSLTSDNFITQNYTNDSITAFNHTTDNGDYKAHDYTTPNYTTANYNAADYITDIFTTHNYTTRAVYNENYTSFKYAIDSYTNGIYTTDNHVPRDYTVDNYTTLEYSTTFLPLDDITASHVARYISAVVLIASCLLGVFGHCAMILAVARTKNIGGSLQGGSLPGGVAKDGGTRLLLTNACLTGLIGCLVDLPMNTANVIGGRLVSSRQMCAVVGFMNVLISSALQASSTAIAVQQCLILLTRHRGRYSRTQATLVVVLSWAVPAALAACASPVVGFNSQLLSCLLEPQREQLPWMPVLVVSMPTWIALGVVATSYALIYRAANRQARIITAQTVARVRAVGAVVELRHTGRGNADGGCWRSGRTESSGTECDGKVEKLQAREECDNGREESLESEDGQGKRWNSRESAKFQEADDKKEVGVSELSNNATSSIPPSTLKVISVNRELSSVGNHSSPTEAPKKTVAKVPTARDRRWRLALKMTINWTTCAVLWGPLSVMFLVDSFEPVPVDALLIGSTLSRIFCGFGWIVHGIWNERLRRTLRCMLSCPSGDRNDHIDPSPFDRQRNRVTPLRVSLPMAQP